MKRDTQTCCMNQQVPEEVRIRRYPNGGWTIAERDSSDPRERGEQVGAYSNASDMLAALSALVGE